ncbi:hypothetical protein ACTPEF_24610, partial [Clostridioides difficile]
EKKIEIVKNPKMPIKKGTVLGKIKICKDKKVIGEVELINTKDSKNRIKTYEKCLMEIFLLYRF